MLCIVGLAAGDPRAEMCSCNVGAVPSGEVSRRYGTGYNVAMCGKASSLTR